VFHNTSRAISSSDGHLFDPPQNVGTSNLWLYRQHRKEKDMEKDEPAVAIAAQNRPARPLKDYRYG